MCYLSLYIYLYIYIFISVYLSSYVSIDLFIYLSVCLSVCLFVYRSYPILSKLIYLSIHPSIHPSIYLSLYIYTFISLHLYLSIFFLIYMYVYLQWSTFSFGSIERCSFWTRWDWTWPQREPEAKLLCRQGGIAAHVWQGIGGWFLIGFTVGLPGLPDSIQAWPNYIGGSPWLSSPLLFFAGNAPFPSRQSNTLRLVIIFPRIWAISSSKSGRRWA